MSEMLSSVCCVTGFIIVVIYFYYQGLILQKKEEERQAQINRHRHEWGDYYCDLVIDKQVVLDMTADMVRLSWGNPTSIDQQEIMKSGTKVRFVYGIPRRGAKYVWLKNGVVTKIKL